VEAGLPGMGGVPFCRKIEYKFYFILGHWGGVVNTIKVLITQHKSAGFNAGGIEALRR